MTVKELREMLESYNENAQVIIVDWSNGREYDSSIGSDDEDEGINYCRIGID